MAEAAAGAVEAAAAAAAAAAAEAGVTERIGGVIRGLPTKRHPGGWHAKRECHNCGEEGHMSRDCPARTEAKAGAAEWRRRRLGRRRRWRLGRLSGSSEESIAGHPLRVSGRVAKRRDEMGRGRACFLTQYCTDAR